MMNGIAMQRTMKILAWYNLFLSGLFIILNVKTLLTGNAKGELLLLLLPVFILMTIFLLGQRMFMKMLAWYTLIFCTFSLFIYIANSIISIWSTSTVIMLSPLVIFSILYLLFRRMDVEDQLEKFYLNLFKKMGMPKWQSYMTTKQMLKQCKGTAQKEGTLNLPINYGDTLLEKEESDEKIKRDLSSKRKEGVTDQDIRSWWNQHDLARRMMLAFDELSQVALITKYIDKDKMTVADAIQRARKYYAFWGNPEDTTHTSGDDRPLPPELKLRIIEYMEKRNRNDRDKYNHDMESSSSYNALVRREIKAGYL